MKNPINKNDKNKSITDKRMKNKNENKRMSIKEKLNYTLKKVILNYLERATNYENWKKIYYYI